MIDNNHLAASWFLWIAPSLFGALYALPLLLAPVRWARRFRWDVSAVSPLTIYLARCVGGVAIAICIGCFRAAPNPAAHAIVFEVVAAVGALMTVVHVWGALERSQPWTETAEIALYAGLTVVAWALRP
jgi:hypothetical protein